MPPGSRSAQALARFADQIAALAVFAALLGLVAPSRCLARHSDLLLACLVAFTALGVAPARLAGLRARWLLVLALSVGPFVVLAALGWALSRGFDGPVRDGLIAIGLSCSEVAGVGLVALAGGDAVLALGVVTCSLVASAVLGPLLAGVLAHTVGHVGVGGLLTRFALVVIVPLIAGLLVRGSLPCLQRAEPALAGLSTLAVCALVYAALSGVHGDGQLGAASLAAVAFLVANGMLALGVARALPRRDAAAVALPIALRDFAVAAALAGQAFGPSSATVAGVYGVLMLIAGAGAATAIRRRASG